MASLKRTLSSCVFIKLWKFPFPRAKSFSHKVVGKRKQGSYFTCSQIRMIAVHPDKDGRYNQDVIQ